MNGIYLCTHCDQFKDCANPSKLQQPSTLITCPYDNLIVKELEDEIH